jgi:hypothetical protein
MATALDYSAARLAAATIKAAGHAGVIRYVGTPGRTKNITKSEYEDLTRNDVGVALVYENRAGDANGGFSAGANAARAARADADSIGWPRDRPIYFAIDSDQVTSLDFQEVSGYLDGAASVLGDGIERTGVYGEYDVIERNVGSHARHGWQTVAWSGGRISKKAALYQRLGQIHIGGIQVDVNSILAADWGQHNAQEDDMPDEATFKRWVGEAVDSRISAIVAQTRDAVRYQVLATDHDPNNPATFNFDGRNIIDILLQILANTFALLAKTDGASAEEIATKLLPALTTAMIDELQSRDAISDEDAEQIAKAVTDRAGTLLLSAGRTQEVSQ